MLPYRLPKPEGDEYGIGLPTWLAFAVALLVPEEREIELREWYIEVFCRDAVNAEPSAHAPWRGVGVDIDRRACAKVGAEGEDPLQRAVCLRTECVEPLQCHLYLLGPYASHWRMAARPAVPAHWVAVVFAVCCAACGPQFVKEGAEDRDQ